MVYINYLWIYNGVYCRFKQNINFVFYKFVFSCTLFLRKSPKNAPRQLFSLNIGGRPLAYDSIRGLCANLFSNHKILHFCPWNTCDIYCVVPLPFKQFAVFEIKFACVKFFPNTIEQNQWVFVVVVFAGFVKHLHMFLLHYPAPPHNTSPRQFMKCLYSLFSAS